MMNRLKKMTLLLGAVFMLALALFIPIETTQVQAAEEQGKVYVTDDAAIFTDDEEAKLTKLCKKTSDNCKTDIVIITMKQGLDGTALDNYVRGIINEKYGYDANASNPDAIVYVIDMKSRADRIVTSGNAKSDITQEELDDIRKSAEKQLTKSKYYKGCAKFIDGVERRMNVSLVYRLTYALPIKILISAGIAVAVVLVMMFNAKSKMTVDSRTYTKEHGFDVRRREDRFINTTVVKHHIQSSSGGSGGGGGGGGNSGSSGGHF